MIQRRELLASSLGAALLTAVGMAQAQSTKPVRIVVPFAPGGVQDTLARSFSVEMGAALGQTVIVENRAGAGGTIGNGSRHQSVRLEFCQNEAVDFTTRPSVVNNGRRKHKGPSSTTRGSRKQQRRTVVGDWVSKEAPPLEYKG